jgi:hypothetical protein
MYLLQLKMTVTGQNMQWKTGIIHIFYIYKGTKIPSQQYIYIINNVELNSG